MRNVECVSFVNILVGDLNVEKFVNWFISVLFVMFFCVKRNVLESIMKWLCVKYYYCEIFVFEWNKIWKVFFVLVWYECSVFLRKWWLMFYRRICMLKIVI